MNFEQNAVRPVRSVLLVDVLALLGLTLVAFALIAKNLAIDNAVVFHDEYLYKVWSDATVDHVWMLQHGVASPMPNRLFAWVFRPAAHAGLNAYDFAQLINVGFWAVGCAAIWTLARRLRVSSGHLLVFGLALVTLPLSSYTKYFMPETMYTGMFLAATWLLIDGQVRTALVRTGLAGTLIGAMYFVKPHALFALGVGVAFALTFANRWRTTAALLGGFAFAFLVLRKVLPTLAPPSPHDLGIYEDMLRSLSERLKGYSEGQTVLMVELLHVAAPHVAMFSVLFGVPLVVALGQVFPGWRLLRNSDAVPAEVRAFVKFLLIATLALMGVAVLFTVLAGESGRVHTRYYMFLFPLWLIQLALLRSTRLSIVGACVATVVLLAGGAWLRFFARTYSTVLPISHVSDGPEWGVVFAGPWFHVSLGLLMLTGLWTAWRGYGSRALLLAVAFASTVATVETAVAQKSIFRNGTTDGRDAVSVEQLIGKGALRHLVVIGPNTGEIDKFLFFLRDIAYVDVRAETSHVDDIAQRFPDADWLVTVVPGYVLSDKYACRPVGNVRLCALTKMAEETIGPAR